MAEHGTRNCYLGGCRLPQCKKADSDYRKAYRREHAAAGKAARSLRSAQTLQLVAEAEPGRVELGVLAELASLSTAEKRPGLVEAALAMARLLDSPTNTAQHPQAGARLESMLDKLRKGSDGRKSWLSNVRTMTPRTNSETG